MSVRRVLIFGGTALVAMLGTTAAGALPTPPTTAGVPLPTLPGPKVVRLPHRDPPRNVVLSPPTKSLPTATLPRPSRPALPTDQPRFNMSSRATPPAARDARDDVAGTGSRPASIEHERTTGAPAVDTAVADARQVGASGALDARSNAPPWSPLGTAATGLASWGALCALALLARWIVISAWRDARRRRRAFSLR